VNVEAEVLDLHKAMIDAHWNKDVDFFLQGLSDDFVSVSSGEIHSPTREEVRERFGDYLNNTTFSEYRDLREPMIGVSRDGSMAWSLVQVKVAGKRTMDDGSERDLDFVCAWITIYEREGDAWVRRAEVSTFR
jgi:hypothetical protein